MVLKSSLLRFAIATCVLIESVKCSCNPAGGKCGGKKGSPDPCCLGSNCGAGNKCVSSSPTTPAPAPSPTPPSNTVCPVTSLYTMCIGWVRGKSGKLHILAQIGANYADGTPSGPIDGATVEYKTYIDGNHNTAVTTQTGSYIFQHYNSDFTATCGNETVGVTGNANCFEKGVQVNTTCQVNITNIEYPGCTDPDVFDPSASGNTEECKFAGKEAPAPCVPE